jgi:hypothetical protein
MDYSSAQAKSISNDGRAPKAAYPFPDCINAHKSSNERSEIELL